MNRIVLLILCAFIFTNGKGANDKVHTSSMKCEITGKLKHDINSDMVYLSKLSHRQFVVTDSAKVKNGNFVLETDAGAIPSVRYLSLKGIDTPIKIFIDSENLVVRQSDDGFVVKGSEANEAYNAMQEESKPIRETQLNAYKRWKDKSLSMEARKQAEQDLYKAVDDAQAIVVKYLKENQKNILGFDILSNNYHSLEAPVVEQYMINLPEIYRQEESYKRMAAFVENDKKCLPGYDYHDVELKTPEGETKKLSDYIKEGQFTIIDFWASWCGPCRAEMPNMVKIYKDFNNSGVEIIGVSLDKDETAWKKGIKDLNMTWPQLSDLKFWQSKAAEAYGVQSIPMTVIIAPNGRILKKNLRGEQLYNEVASWAKKLK